MGKVESQTLKSPQEFFAKGRVVENTDTFTIPTIPLISVVKFYQNTLSQIKGENCRMYPTCSQYSLHAIQVNGLYGILQSADRLHRCGHDLEFYNTVIYNNRIKFLDIVPINK